MSSLIKGVIHGFMNNDQGWNTWNSKYRNVHSGKHLLLNSWAHICQAQREQYYIYSERERERERERGKERNGDTRLLPIYPSCYLFQYIYIYIYIYICWKSDIDKCIIWKNWLRYETNHP